MTTATSLPSSRVIRVVQTDVLFPTWIGVDSPVTVEPTFAEGLAVGRVVAAALESSASGGWEDVR